MCQPNGSKTTNYKKLKTLFTLSINFVRFLELYPNGLEEENKSNVSLYLCSKSAEEAKCIDFRVKFKLGIAKKGRKDDYVVAEMNPSKKLLENGYGYPEFLSHAELFDEEAGFIVDGTFTVFVDVSCKH